MRGKLRDKRSPKRDNFKRDLMERRTGKRDNRSSGWINQLLEQEDDDFLLEDDDSFENEEELQVK